MGGLGSTVARVSTGEQPQCPAWVQDTSVNSVPTPAWRMERSGFHLPDPMRTGEG
jgi:hypothetical protein